GRRALCLRLYVHARSAPEWRSQLPLGSRHRAFSAQSNEHGLANSPGRLLRHEAGLLASRLRRAARLAAARLAWRAPMTRFSFSIAATDGAARTGTIAMQRGEIRTPAFMPVGTAAT